MYTLRERLAIQVSWARSFFRSDWDLKDYPIRVRPNPVPDARIAWHAQIMNWPGPIGLGATPESAISSLNTDFERIKANRHEHGEPLPRPGAKQRLTFAPTDRVDRDPELAEDFFRNVIGIRELPYFFSDESGLFEFGSDEEVDEYRRRAKERYGVSIDGLDYLGDIFEKIFRERG